MGEVVADEVAGHLAPSFGVAFAAYLLLMVGQRAGAAATPQLALQH